MTNEAHHLILVLLSGSMVFSLMAILLVFLRARLAPTLFEREGYKVFGIYHEAMYGERRANNRNDF